MKKRLVLTVLALVALFCGAFSAVCASADGTGAAFAVKDGAWIRDAEPAGIRFIATVNQAFTDEVQSENEGKTIVFGTEFSVPEADKVIRKDCEVWANESTETEKSYKTVLVGIPQDNYLTKITAKAYYKVMNGETEEKLVYADEIGVTRSIFEVAKAAAAAGETNDFVSEIIANACKSHVWDNGKVVTAPTADAMGETVYTCTKCGETETVNTLVGKDYEQYSGITDGARVANTEDLTVSREGAVSAIFNGKTYTAESGSVTIPATDLTAITAGTYTVRIVTGDNKYEFVLSVVNKIIDDKDDMLNIQLYDNGTEDYSGYFVLANNIDFKGGENNPEIKAAWSYGGTTGGFHGVFDGRGYTIKNVRITTYGGLFGSVNADGTIKNVAFENIDIVNTDGSPMGGVLGIELCGKMENVFISATLNGTPHSAAIANYVTGCEIKNSVFVVGGTLSDSLSGALANHMGWSASHPVFDNCYVVTELGKLWHTITDNPDGTQTIKITQGATSVEATGLDESIWDMNGDYPTFITGTKAVILADREYEQYTGVADGVRVANTADITITQEGAVSATFNNTQYNAENGSVTIPAADLVAADGKEYTVNVNTADEVYAFNLSLYTKKISTTDDMLNIQTYGNGTDDYDGYFVLANDIDFEGGVNNPEIKKAWSYGGATGGFHGVFDGKFYSIKNLNITTYGGLFGCVNASATVKNVAFVNVNI